MMFGCGEELRHRVKPPSNACGRIQEDTGGFTAFIPWMFAAENTALGKKSFQEATAVDYLKTLAFSACISTTSTTSNQAGSRPESKFVRSVYNSALTTSAASLSRKMCLRRRREKPHQTKANFRRVISDAGFIPAQRDTLYRSYALNEFRNCGTMRSAGLGRRPWGAGEMETSTTMPSGNSTSSSKIENATAEAGLDFFAAPAWS